MPNLHDTLLQMSSVKTANAKILLQKTKIDLSITGSAKGSNTFHQLSLDLSRLPLLGSTGSEDGPIVVDANVDRLHRTTSKYTPKLIILSGLGKLRSLKASMKDTKGVPCNVWLGTKAMRQMDIRSAEDVGSNELSTKVQKAIADAYSNKAPKNCSYDMAYSKTPWISEIYPFDSYAIFSLDGKILKQKFTFDTTSRTVKLNGAYTAVHQEYVEDVAAEATAVDPLMYRNTTRQIGSAVSLMTNVEEALASYRLEVAMTQHKVIMSSQRTLPANLVTAEREAKIAIESVGLSAGSVSVPDFLNWQTSKLALKASDQTKLYNNEILFASDYAYVGDKKDISTWHLPMHTMSSARESLEALDTEVAIPKNYIDDARNNLMRAGGVIQASKGKPNASISSRKSRRRS